MVQEWHKIRPPDVETLRGIPAIWTVRDLTKVLEPCVGEDGDFNFEKKCESDPHGIEDFCAHVRETSFTQEWLPNDGVS